MRKTSEFQEFNESNGFKRQFAMKNIYDFQGDI